MFHALRNTLTGSENKMNLNELRLKYGLLDEDRGHVFLQQPLPEVHYFESKPKEYEIEEKVIETGAPIQNPLEKPCIKINIKKESFLEENACEFENLEEDDIENEVNESFEEDPFNGNNVADINIIDPESILIKSEAKMSETSGIETVKVRKRKIQPKSSKSNHKVLLPKRRAHRNRKSDTCRILKKEKVKDYEEMEEDASSSDNQDLILCLDCPRKFRRRQQYRQHMELTHSKVLPKPEWRCKHCPRVFSVEYRLKRHMLIHISTEEKIHPCMYCDKKFTTPEYASHHMKYLHMTDKSFICEECGYPTRTSAALKEHMLTHTDHAPFECEVCEKKFKSQSRLKNHMEIHNPTKHICAECGLQLNSRPTLNRHLLIHSDEMRHKCDYCGRAFKRAKALKNHLILHTGLKPYSCDFCDRTFANGSNCRTHKKKAHPEELAALEASGHKTYARNIPKLEALKAVTKSANNLAPVASKQSGCFAFGKKPKNPLKTVSDRANAKYRKQAYTTVVATQPPAGPEIELSAIPQNASDVSLISANNIGSIPTIDNIYNHIMKQSTSMANNSANCMEAPTANHQQQHHHQQPSQQHVTLLPSQTDEISIRSPDSQASHITDDHSNTSGNFYQHMRSSLPSLYK